MQRICGRASLPPGLAVAAKADQRNCKPGAMGEPGDRRAFLESQLCKQDFNEIGG